MESYGNSMRLRAGCLARCSMQLTTLRSRSTIGGFRFRQSFLIFLRKNGLAYDERDLWG